MTRHALIVREDGPLPWRTELEPEPLPDEWVLRGLADANLEDDHAVAALLDRGVISWPYFDRGYVPQERWPRLAPSPSLEELRTGAWWEPRFDGTLEDARWWLKTARALAQTWAYVRLDKDPTSAWDAAGFNVIDEVDLWTQFTISLDIGLKAFRSRVEYVKDYRGVHQHTFGAPRVGLYSAACRQVFNLIVNDDTARVCENETCGRLFVHQLGGSDGGRRRSAGLKFCSPTCARAQTQRQYRRNVKKKG